MLHVNAFYFEAAAVYFGSLLEVRESQIQLIVSHEETLQGLHQL